MANGRQSEGLSSLLEKGIVFPNEEHSGLFFGKQVSVLCGRHRPEIPILHEHEQIQLVLTFDNSLAQVVWRKGDSVQTEQISARRFCFVPPGIAHACRWTQDAEVVILFLDKTALAEYVQHPLGGVIFGDFRALCRADPLLWPLAETLRNLTAQVSSSATSSLALTLAGRLLDCHHQQAETDDATLALLPPAAIDKVSAYIDTHLKEELTSGFLARYVGLSPGYFTRLFRNTEGVTPTQYIAKRRVEKALELLGTGEYRVAEAACEVGFYDQSHLDRHCRKFFGQSPKFLLKSTLKAS